MQRSDFKLNDVLMHEPLIFTLPFPHGTSGWQT